MHVVTGFLDLQFLKPEQLLHKAVQVILSKSSFVKPDNLTAEIESIFKKTPRTFNKTNRIFFTLFFVNDSNG